MRRQTPKLTWYWTCALWLMITMVLLAPALAAQAAPAYPTRPITLIVAFPPGGGADITGRLVADYLSKRWGQPINVVNVSGGGSIPGVKQALESRPDGYTLLVDVHVTAAMLPATYSNLPFDWRQRTFIARVTTDPSMYLVNANAPYRTLQELANAVRANPRRFSWGGTGPAGLSTFVLGQFFDAIGVEVGETNMVSLGGTAPALTALAGGHIELAAGFPSDAGSLIAAGKIRPLAVVSPRRLEQYPDVPTVAEAGFPQLNVIGWQGISGPPGLPAEVVEKWATALEQASRDPQFIAMATKLHKNVAYLGPNEFKTYVEKEYERFLDLANKLGIRR